MEGSTHGVKVLDPVAGLLIPPEVVLVLLRVELGLVVVPALLLQLENVDVVDMVGDDVELRRGLLDVFGDFRCVNHFAWVLVTFVRTK